MSTEYLASSNLLCFFNILECICQWPATLMAVIEKKECPLRRWKPLYNQRASNFYTRYTLLMCCKSNSELTIIKNYNIRNRFALLVHRIMNPLTANEKEGTPGFWELTFYPQLYNNWKLSRFSFWRSHLDLCSLLEQQKNIESLLKSDCRLALTVLVCLGLC